MSNEQLEQVGTYVQTVIEIETVELPTLAARMRYQRELLREVLMFWPDVSPLEVVEKIIAPRVGAMREWN